MGFQKSGSTSHWYGDRRCFQKTHTPGGEKSEMKEETREYLRGERNATRDEFVLSREAVGQAERVYLSLPDEENTTIYELWTKKAKKNKRATPVGDIVTMEVVDSRAEQEPKHTGGKRPYVMVMQDKSKEIESLSLESRGFLLTLYCSGCVEWNTGKIIHRRTKKNLHRATMPKQFNVSPTALKSVLAELSGKKIITYDPSQKAYFVSRDFAKKGATK